MRLRAWLPPSPPAVRATPLSTNEEMPCMTGADREYVRRLGKFLVVGASGVVVNNAALFTLYQVLRLPLLGASTAAVVLSIVNNFFWNDRWTFEQDKGAFSSAMRR